MNHYFIIVLWNKCDIRFKDVIKISDVRVCSKKVSGLIKSFIVTKTIKFCLYLIKRICPGLILKSELKNVFRYLKTNECHLFKSVISTHLVHIFIPNKRRNGWADLVQNAGIIYQKPKNKLSHKNQAVFWQLLLSTLS